MLLPEIIALLYLSIAFGLVCYAAFTGTHSAPAIRAKRYRHSSGSLRTLCPNHLKKLKRTQLAVIDDKRCVECIDKESRKH